MFPVWKRILKDRSASRYLFLLNLRRYESKKSFGFIVAFLFAVSNLPIERTGGHAMLILTLKLLTLWSLIATVTSFALGAAIGKEDRLLKDEILTFLFSTISNQQASR